MNSIKFIQDEFIKEATNAPILFRDLARVEQYIAESYKTRSFIELIQNADDANSTKLGIFVFDDFVIVGNNGRNFTNEDVIALCRSGASNKKRGENTIGYRGIGFKSVVNLAEQVYILSGDLKFMYDKKLTQNLIKGSEDVPLIRIPHVIDMLPHKEKLVDIKEKYGYTTIFLFNNIKENIVEDELYNFDKSSIIFLNSLIEINLFSKDVKRRILKNVKNNVCCISEEDETEYWKIIAYNNCDKIAFKIENNKIISALPNESVIHSFTPTMETVGGYFKINGDFSTDPSRKNIDFDELSESSYSNCIDLITNILIKILDGSNEYIGFFNPFNEFDNSISSNKMRFKLLNSIKNKLSKKIDVENLRLKPDMISFEDYEEICNEKYIIISRAVLNNYPEITTFLKLLSINTLSLNEMTNAIEKEDSKISEVGKAIIFSEVVKKNSFDFNPELQKKINNSKIFCTKNSSIKPSELKSFDNLSDEYKKILNDNCEKDELKYVFRKLGIEYEDKNKEIENKDENKKNTNILKSVFETFKKNEVKNNKFEKYSTMKRWKSSEENLTEYLKCANIVQDVKNVSNANLGYDIEATLNEGKRIYIEVKSLTSFNQPFEITNNEYTCAHSYGELYYIALVINDSDFDVMFIQNPIMKLNFEKKIKQWSWFCDDYKKCLIDESQVK